MIKHAIALLVALILILVPGCKTKPVEKELSRYYYPELQMGTVFHLQFYAPDQATADRAARAAYERVAQLDKMMSDYIPDSELRQLSLAPVGKPIAVSPDMFRILQTSLKISAESKGAFDVTLGPEIQLWRSSRKSHRMPAPEEVTAAKQSSGYQNLHLDAKAKTVTLLVPGMKLDLGGIAKGFAADAALEVLRTNGIRRAMMAASGDIALGDPPPGKPGWTIDIQSIDHTGNGRTDRLVLSHAGISTSGDTEQYVEIEGKRYSHIVDPKTGLGLLDRIGVTIVAPNATTSDGFSTTVSVMGATNGLRFAESHPGIGVMIVHLTEHGRDKIENDRYKRLPRPSDPQTPKNGL